MFEWLKRIFDRSADPVHSCDLYRDKEAGSCVHVDGPLCDFPECSMLADYRQQKEKEMTDIVERLNDSLSAGHSELRKEAAEEIRRLRAKIEQMEKQEPYCTAIGPGDWTYQISSPARPGVALYALPGAQPQLNEIKITLQRALELGKRQTWTGARKHHSWEEQREEHQCWNKVWSLLGAQGEEK